ncbi:MAG: sulfatase-like hydrolase/transferase [Acidobacteria bacterium]|nr:sulfatase-like hydrolase/transferase [Acidobacteriota bacterium]
MLRRRFLSALPAAPAALAAARRPNVLIFLADDLGWHDVGFHGSEIATPNIDRLASQGVRFERAYSFPVCSPTRSGLMTGRSPMRLGVAYTVIRPWSNYGVPLGERFMSQAFLDAGYQTAIAGKWHLGHARRAFFPNARGFSSAYGHMNGAIDYFTHIRDGGLDWNRDGKSVREEGYSTFLLGDEATRFIRKRDKSRPFFLYVPFNSPHAPLQAPPEYLARYSSIADTRRRSYAAMTSAMDDTIGRVLGTLDSEDIAGDTLVLFFSDNGGPLPQGATNTPLRAGKGTTFEGGIRVPCCMRFPGRAAAGVVSQQVLTMCDYFPTLAAAAGVSPGGTLPLDGRNLWPAISSGRVVPRGDLFFSIGRANGLQYAIHRREWKLVREIPSSGAPTNLLFHILDDPNETTDLSAKHPALVADLTAAIDRWAALHPRDGVREGPQPDGYKAPPQWAEAAAP